MTRAERPRPQGSPSLPRRLVKRQRLRLAALKAPFLRLLARCLDRQKAGPTLFGVLHRLLDQHPTISLGQFLDEAGKQSQGLAVLILALLTFIPGVANILSLVTLVLGIRIAAGSTRIWLPEVLRRRKIQRGPIKQLLARIEARIAYLSPLRGPRRAPSPQATGILVAWTAFLAALPLPLPFANVLPAAALVLYGVAFQEEWPALGWLGLGITVATTIYFGYSFNLALAAVRSLFHAWQ